jgi:spoIIIJ-associated protein
VKDAAAVIKEVAVELLSKLDILAGVEVVDQGENLFHVNVATEESGLLIGYHGETLQSLQIMLGQLVFKKLGQWVRIVVEVGDYRAKREEQLISMANSWAAQAISTGVPVYVPFLPPGERRVVHIALQERTDVETLSEGEGRNRQLVIRAKTS